MPDNVPASRNARPSGEPRLETARQPGPSSSVAPVVARQNSLTRKNDMGENDCAKSSGVLLKCEFFPGFFELFLLADIERHQNGACAAPSTEAAPSRRREPADSAGFHL